MAQREMLVDRHFERAGAVDHPSAPGGNSPQEIHPKDDLLEPLLWMAAAGHAPHHDEIGLRHRRGPDRLPATGGSGDCRRQMLPRHDANGMAAGSQRGGQPRGMPAGRFSQDRNAAAAHAPAPAAFPAACSAGLENDVPTIVGARLPNRCRRPVSTFTMSSIAGAKSAGSSA